MLPFADEHVDETVAGPTEVQLYVEARMALETDPPNPQKAHEIISRLLSKYPKDASLHLTHAEAFAGMAKYGKATKAWNEAKRLGAQEPSLDRVAAMIPKLREQVSQDEFEPEQDEDADPCQADPERQSEESTVVETATEPGSTKECPPKAAPDEPDSDPGDSPPESATK